MENPPKIKADSRATLILSTCFICASKSPASVQTSLSGNDGAHWSFNSSLQRPKLWRQLDVIFILRNVLEFPPARLENYLELWGDPESWVELCDHCANEVGNAKDVYGQLQKVSRQYEELSEGFRKRIQSASKSCSGERAEVIVKDWYRLKRKRKPKTLPSSPKKSFLECDRLAGQLAAAYVQEPSKYCQVEMVMVKHEADVTIETEEEPEANVESEWVSRLRTTARSSIICPSPELNEQEAEEDPLDIEFDVELQEENYSSSSNEEDEDEDFYVAANAKKRRTTTTTTTTTSKAGSRSVATFESRPVPVLKSTSDDPSSFIYACNLCPPRKYFNFPQFLNHIFHVHQISHKCVNCSRGFINFDPRVITDHYRNYHRALMADLPMKSRVEEVTPELPQVSWNCPNCHDSFPEENLRDSHVTNCAGEISRDWNCEACKGSYFTDDELKLHIVLVHPDQYAYQPHRCSHCGRCFKTEKKLRSHRIQVHNLDLYTCEQCDGKDFVDEKRWKMHMHTKHGVAPEETEAKKPPRVNISLASLDCEVCGRQLKSHRNLRFHLFSVHGIQVGQAPKTYPCPVEGCGQVMYRPGLFQQHMKMHITGVKPRCTICEKDFTTQPSLDMHDLIIHRIVKPSTAHVSFEECKRCQKRFRKKANLLIHAQVCTDQKDYVECDICFTKFPSNKDLRNHKIFKHSIPSKLLPEEEEEGKEEENNGNNVEAAGDEPSGECYPCPKCGKVFTVRHCLLRHERSVHQEKKQYVCDHCPVTKSVKSELDYHMAKKHDVGAEHFKCVECGYFCKSKREKLKHICGVKTHRFGSKTYVCPVCGKEWPCRSMMVKHIATVHEKRFSSYCDICGYGTNGQVLLARHMANSHNVGEWKCEVEGCHKAFSKEKALQDHVKYRHMGVKKPLNMVVCDYCGKALNGQQKLKKHIQAMHTNKETRPYKCLECGKGFPCASYLSLHRKTHRK